MRSCTLRTLGTTTRIARTFAFAHQIVIGLGAALTRERCSAYYVGGAAVAIAGVSAYSLAKNLRTKVAHMRIRMLHARAVLLAPQPDALVLLAPQPDFLSQLLGCATDSGSAAERPHRSLLPLGHFRGVPNNRRMRIGLVAGTLLLLAAFASRPVSGLAQSGSAAVQLQPVPQTAAARTWPVDAPKMKRARKISQKPRTKQRQNSTRVS